MIEYEVRYIDYNGQHQYDDVVGMQKLVEFISKLAEEGSTVTKVRVR